MKRILSFFLALVVLTSAFSLTLQAVSPRNNHTVSTNTTFTISDTGLAQVYTRYHAYEDVMTEAVITLTIKKRTLLLFWSEVTTFSISSTEPNYSHTFSRKLDEKGTYKCEVEYVVYGTAGEADVIPFEETVTY